MNQLLRNLLTVLLLPAALVFAQGSNAASVRQEAQHHVDLLSTLLNLSPSQQQQALTIFKASTATETTVRSHMRAARQSLDTAMKTNDIAGIEQISANLGNLTGQLTATLAKAHAALYQILTPDQQTKLSQFQSQRRVAMQDATPAGLGR